MSAVATVVRVLRKVPRWCISLTFIGLVVLFLAVYLRSIDFSQLEHIHVDWTLVLAGSAVAMVFRYWGVLTWRYILRDLGSHDLPSFVIMADVYAKAWMGRYIPGTVTWIAGKIYMAAAHGISKSRLTVASLLEGGMQIIATMVVSFLLIGFDPRIQVIPMGLKLILIAISVIGIVVLYPPIFNGLMALAFQLVRRQKPHDELRINGIAVVRSFGLYAINNFTNGISCFLVTLALVPDLSIGTIWYVIGAFGVSVAVGMATPFVPSGLGVRDGAQLVLLTAVMSKEEALIVTVFTRLWFIVVDVLFFLIATTHRSSTRRRIAAE
jgi:hypothetical protein